MQNFPQDYEIRVLWSIHRGLSGIMEDFREGDTIHVYIVGHDNQFTVETAGFAEDGSLSFAIPPGLPEGIYGLKAVWTHDGSMLFMSEQDEAFSVSEEDDGEDLLYMRSYTMDYSYDVMDDWEAAVFNGHTTVDRSTWLQRQARTEERLMELAAEVARKQNILTAGYGIKIEDDVVSVNFSTDLFIIVDSLPTENIDPTKIYLVPSADHEESNLYIEYIYVQGSWEKMGEFKPEIDLTPYLTKAEARQTYQPQEPGKGLSANDYTDEDKQKLNDQYTREELDQHLDGDFVHRTGDEEIGGKKTFTEEVEANGIYSSEDIHSAKDITANGGVAAMGIHDLTITQGGGSGAAIWGSIGGDIRDQKDLSDALTQKADKTSVYTRTEVDDLLGIMDFDVYSENTDYVRGDTFRRQVNGKWLAYRVEVDMPKGLLLPGNLRRINYRTLAHPLNIENTTLEKIFNS